jgi:peptidoglycan LD-endopeptidase LytH
MLMAAFVYRSSFKLFFAFSGLEFERRSVMKHRCTFLNKCLPYLLIVLIFASCTTMGPSGVFGKKSPHEVYGDKIKEAGLEQTAMGKQWFQAADNALINPLLVNLPYRETGYFPAELPKASGVRFHAKRGEKITINVSKKPATGFAIYIDVWQPSTTNNTTKPKLLTSADTATLGYEVRQEGNYVVRVQPELLKGGEYTLTITNGPSLGFPIAVGVKSSIGSFWGDNRDKGERRHEGIDIFAPKHSPLVAAASGTVTRVEEYGLGGKVIFLSPDNEGYSLYYAHWISSLPMLVRELKLETRLGW